MKKARKEAVFLPYKASMWDSLESVWMAAEADPDCDVYVIPIPYYDKNPDGSFKQEHYEGDLYPEYVPITGYDEYDFEEHRPDMIFIHNPYDDENTVTSVHPFFYSKNLKKFTDTLVYIPYYATTGGMSEGQYSCPAYYHADYIIIQAEKYRKFFDVSLPQEKLVPLGTPKFDKVIRTCNNPPEPPAEWKDKMTGRKVYFYNTSLSGMLANTQAFLKKMEYVFRTFMNRQDACLLWRPHPLMESTFDSMRPAYKPIYEALKNLFITYDLGIYDTTPDITDTIALSDVYIGDAGTSVTSLFGIAGKPIFILNNNINTPPEDDDWRGEIIKPPYVYGDNAWMVTQGNKLYYSQNNDYKYKYLYDLNEYAGGNYYFQVITIDEKHYVCPICAQDILVVTEKEIVRKIQLDRRIEQKGAFYGARSVGEYLFLLPNNYPAIVRYDTKNDTIMYITEGVDICKQDVRGEKRLAGVCVHNGYLFLASPEDGQVLEIHAETGKTQRMMLNTNHICGCSVMVTDGKDLWLLPYEGKVITRWNPWSGEIQEYDNLPENFMCKHLLLGYESDQRPFSFPIFSEDYVYLPPFWGNMYVRLNKLTGEMEEWIPPFEQPENIRNGYYATGSIGYFLGSLGESRSRRCRVFSVLDRRMYDVDLETNEYQEIHIEFDKAELEQVQQSFCENSEWLQYVCEENAFNSLGALLDGRITGKTFDRERQIKSFGTVTANHEGTCGENIYCYVQENNK